MICSDKKINIINFFPEKFFSVLVIIVKQFKNYIIINLKNKIVLRSNKKYYFNYSKIGKPNPNLILKFEFF